MSSSEAVLIDVLHYLFINIILLGFVGNFLSFKIYSTIALRKHTISIYFRVIAIVDSIMLLSGFLYFLEQKYDFNLSRLNQFLCKFRNYTFDAIGPVSPWLMVVVSFDRFISIGFPRRFPIFFKFYFQVTVICVIFVFNIAFYTPMTWTSSLVEENDTDTGKAKIECQQKYAYGEIQWMDFFNSTIIPFLFMILLSAALIYYVRSSRARVGKLSGSSVQSRRDARFAISAVTLNVIFLILNLPVVIDDLIGVSATPNVLFDYFAYVLYYAYFAIEFYALLAVNREFRREFSKLLNLRFRISNMETESAKAKP